MAKILHLIPTLAGGGAERQLAMLAVEQARRGWNVHIGIRRGGVHQETLRTGGVVVHLLGNHKGVNPLLLAKISSRIRRIKPDIVQTWLPQMDIVGGIAALSKSVPWIVTERASILAYHGVQLHTFLRCRLARFAKAIVANSESGRLYWREMLHDTVPISTIANAVDLAGIRSAVQTTGGASYVDQKYILAVGRLTPQKAFDVVVEAIRLVPKRHDFRVLIVGEGDLQKDLETTIRKAGLNDRISLLPYQSDWWGMLKGASAHISMSRYEGHPNVVLETIASGCPLIVSDIPAHREILNDDAALLVPPENPAALAESIASLLADPEAGRERAKRAFACVEKLTIQAAADAYESVYQEVLSGWGC